MPSMVSEKSERDDVVTHVVRVGILRRRSSWCSCSSGSARRSHHPATSCSHRCSDVVAAFTRAGMTVQAGRTGIRALQELLLGVPETGFSGELCMLWQPSQCATPPSWNAVAVPADRESESRPTQQFPAPLLDLILLIFIHLIVLRFNFFGVPAGIPRIRRRPIASAIDDELQTIYLDFFDASDRTAQIQLTLFHLFQLNLPAFSELTS